MWLRLIDAKWISYLYFFMLAGSVAAGYYFARKKYVEKGKVWAPSGIETPVIGFFSLLISFTLLAAYNAAKERNALIHTQGDAIAQLHRDAYFLPGPTQPEVRSFLIRHVDVQLAYYRQEISSLDSVLHLVTDQNESFVNGFLQDSMHKAAFQKIKPAFDGLSSATFKMLYSFEERTPATIMLLLLFASLLIGLLAGFMNGFHKAPHLLVPIIYTVLTFFTLKAILDLNNPLGGNVRPEYQNFVDLKQMLLR